MSGNGDKVEVLVNEPFDDGKLKGNYTYKVFHVSERVPEWIKTIIPSLRTATLEEKSWNAYPFCKSVYECKLLGDRFRMEVISMHLDNDRGQTENALNLDDEELLKRQVKLIDISQIDSVLGVPHPAKFTPAKRPERQPLEGKHWLEQKDRTPVMCCYKVVKLNVGIWPVQESCEQYMIQTQVVKGITEVCVRAWAWLDEYIDMDEKALRDYQTDSVKRLEAYYRGEIDGKGEAKGKQEDDDDVDEKSQAEQSLEAEKDGDVSDDPSLDKSAATRRVPATHDDDTPTCKLVPDIRMPRLSLRLPKMPKLPKIDIQPQLERFVAMIKQGVGGKKTDTDTDSDTTDDKQIEKPTPQRLPPQVPPFWIPDSSAASCSGCERPFSLIVRRHHCRGCGKVMCHDCTSTCRLLSQYIDYYGPKPQRVCQRCDQAQTKMEQDLMKRLESLRTPKSPREMKLREQIRQKARQFRLLTEENRHETRAQRDGRRLLQILIFLTAIIVVILAVIAATKPDSKVAQLLRYWMMSTKSTPPEPEHSYQPATDPV
eukprot:CAMPEP_0197530812 /NCGR_PEP_ID=MMETSP1318-20131121/33006_1 /TAXON_ID=552666 /ORGANISM="Partenskyella glossopodia, Strain RCC365" /LENGTH=540 /DNA_ID=CAMNT_0043086791 /DNA_START=353 /DNA_END=1975 /DNA_ORIENTATION=-